MSVTDEAYGQKPDSLTKDLDTRTVSVFASMFIALKSRSFRISLSLLYLVLVPCGGREIYPYIDI